MTQERDEEFTAAERTWLAQQKAEYLRLHPELAADRERDKAVMAKPKDQLTADEERHREYLRRNPKVLWITERREDEKRREFLRQHPTVRAWVNREAAKRERSE